jgi:hypothetical protein
MMRVFSDRSPRKARPGLSKQATSAVEGRPSVKKNQAHSIAGDQGAAGLDCALRIEPICL